MNIPQKINEIVSERKSNLPKISSALKRVAKIKETLENFENFRNSVSDENFASELASISLDGFKREYDNAVRLLNNLEKRFSRDRINISFVGRAGQGKSLVMQQISGLKGDIIPSAQGSDCTGARSIISNIPSGDTRAEITFYTEIEYVGIVNKYLKKIFPDGTYRANSIESVSSLNISELKRKIAYSQVEETSLFDHLVKYIEHAAELRPLLGTKTVTSSDKIEEYVAQYKSNDISVKYYKFLAVKEANILSVFPRSETCGNIVLVDTIGTGATSLGVEDAMLKTVREDSDAIILMMRPDPLRPRVAVEEYNLVEKISDAVTPEYAKEMLFWVINRVEDGAGSNAGFIGEVLSRLKSQELPVSRYLEVNCANRQDVEEKLLIPLLEQMSSRLSDIDNLILKRSANQLNLLKKEFASISASIERVQRSSVSEDIKRAFATDINKMISMVTDNIRELIVHWYKELDNECPIIRDAANEKLKNVFRLMPKKEKIFELLSNGRLTNHNVLQKLADELRINVINDFLQLNPTLDSFVRDVKKEVVDVLADKGCLKSYVNSDTDNPELWLQDFINKLKEENTDFHLMIDALKPLRDFSLSMENFLIFNVRVCLDDIDWSLMTQAPQIQGGMYDKELAAEDAESYLYYAVETIHSNIEKELSDYYRFPHKAAFAVLRDFYDRAVFAVSEKGDVNTEWRYLYENNIPLIWEEKYKRYGSEKAVSDSWNLIISQIRSIVRNKNIFEII